MAAVNNIHAIFMASKITTTSHTEHMNIRCKNVNEYVEEGMIKIIFVMFADNESNVLTKNLRAELHKKHSKKMVGEKF